MINVDEDYNDGNLCFERAQPKQNNTKLQQHVWKAVGGSVYFINPPPSQLLSNNNVTLNIGLLNKNISHSHEIVCLEKPQHLGWGSVLFTALSSFFLSSC